MDWDIIIVQAGFLLAKVKNYWMIYVAQKRFELQILASHWFKHSKLFPHWLEEKCWVKDVQCKHCSNWTTFWVNHYSPKLLLVNIYTRWIDRTRHLNSTNSCVMTGSQGKACVHDSGLNLNPIGQKFSFGNQGSNMMVDKLPSLLFTH